MAVDPLWVPDRGEVIFINHSPAKGQEIPDQHPMLVLSPKSFNEKTGIVIGFPMTHADTHKDNPFALPFQGPKGLAFVLAHQPKSFDWRQRGGRPHPWGGGHHELMAEAAALLDDVCDIVGLAGQVKQ